jgi:protein involved in polysaccharide export with SLBB domain
MKSLVFAALVLSACLAITASGQVKSVAAANNPASSKSAIDETPDNSTRERVLGQGPKVVSTTKNAARPDFNHSDVARYRRVNTSPSLPTDSAGRLKPIDPTKTAALESNTSAISSAPIATPLTQVYRVGVGDVLNVRLSENPARNSTLFTVLEHGVLEYPLAENPIVVSGMTTSEIADRLRQQIKIFENPTVTVDVRDYASHEISISGLVAAAGTKVLRREAVPLYTMLAEALVLPEAARATITRQGGAPIVVDLKNENLSETLVIPGDAIKVTGMPPAPTEFFFAGGEISSPGQKPYHEGLTLTQAILASGGTKASAGARVRVSRQGADGKLIAEEFNLRKIQTGKTPDPVLQKGDRIEVTTAN